MDRKEIGRKLADLRGERSQTEVAAVLGISSAALSMYESGERVPRDEIKVKIASFYGVPVQDIFFAGTDNETL